MFRRERERTPVHARDLWHDQHVRWPLERTLIATVPGFADFTRSPLTEIADDYRRPGSQSCKVWLPPWLFLSSSTKKLIVSIVSSRLGIEDPQAW